MSTELSQEEQDILALEELAFKQVNKLKKLLLEVHRLLRDPGQKQYHEALNRLRRWLITSFTLWPADFKGFGKHLCALLTANLEVNAEIQYLLKHLPELPDKEARRVVSLKEKEVEQGIYDPYLSEDGQRKKMAYEKELFENPKFQAEWEEFIALFPQYLKSKKVWRRRLCMERNFRSPDFDFDPNNPEHVAMLAFDLFCYRWNLFGMEAGKPLLLKLSVNATPHGIMIVIPSYWSLDFKRDLNWTAINEVHKSWGMMRHGDRWNRAEIAERRRKAYHAKVAGVAGGKSGAELYDFVIEQAGLPKLMEHANVRKEIRFEEELVLGLD